MTIKIEWEERYKTGDLPWDIGTPDEELKKYFAELKLANQPVLEIGCGTGTNAIWMAQQGCSVVATELSPKAVELAKQKAKEANVQVEFKVSDICKESATKPGSVKFVFDRGVYHAMMPEHRDIFVKHTAEALMPGGYWLCLAGSKDQKREEGELGPPQLTAVDIIVHAEQQFEIQKLERIFFTLPNGEKHLAWSILMKKRA